MSILKRTVTVALCSVAVVAAAGSANAGHRYKHGEKRVYTEQERSYVVDDSATVRTPFDYFFNNPEKYKSYRNDPGEYYEGVTR